MTVLHLVHFSIINWQRKELRCYKECQYKEARLSMLRNTQYMGTYETIYAGHKVIIYVLLCLI